MNRGRDMFDTSVVFDKWRAQFLNEKLLLKPGTNGWDLDTLEKNTHQSLITDVTKTEK